MLNAKNDLAVTLFPVVAAALVDGDGRVLVQQRPTGKAYGGLWEFPGGKVEPGETPEAALVRELTEELGVAVDATALEPLTFATEAAATHHLVLLLYVVRTWAGTPTAMEGQPVRWVAPDALAGLSMPPADRGFPAALMRVSGSPDSAVI